MNMLGLSGLRNEKGILAVIFIIALALRVIPVMNLPAQYQTQYADAKQYDTLAVNLLAGKGFIHSGSGLPTSWRVPLYPIFLASIYFLFGHNYTAVRLIQCILWALLCVILFKIAKILFDERVALLSAITLAFYQPFIFYAYFGGPAFLLSENLFIFLLALFLLYLMKGFLKEPSLKNMFLSGILLGLASLTRPVIALFPLFLFGLLMYKNRCGLLSTIKKMLPLVIGSILVILPWTARNYFVHKAFVPSSTEGGYVLCAANTPQAKGGGPPGDFKRPFTEEERKQLSGMSEVEMDNLYRKYGKQFLFRNFKERPQLFFKKLLCLWDIYTTDYELDGSCVRKYNIWYAIVLMFGIFGIAKSLYGISKFPSPSPQGGEAPPERREGGRGEGAKFIVCKSNINTLLLILLFAYFSIIAMVFSGEARFRNPVEPYLIIFASVGIFAIYDAFRNKFLSFITIGIIIAVNFLLYAKSDLLLDWARRIIC